MFYHAALIMANSWVASIFFHKGNLQSMNLNVVWLYSVSPSGVRYLWQMQQFLRMDLPTFLPLLNCLSVTENLLFPSLSVMHSKMDASSAVSPLKDASLSVCLLDRTVNFLQIILENSSMSTSRNASFLRFR